MRFTVAIILQAAFIGAVSASLFQHGNHSFNLADGLLEKLKDIASETHHIGEFLVYTAKYGKMYEFQEMERHFKHYVANLASIKEHALKHKHCKFGLTKFADWAQSEFKKVLGLRYVEPGQHDPLDVANPDSTTIPTSLDYRTKDQVTSVKDQGQCGSCWAFAAASVMESQYLIHKSESLDLSEEHILNCDTYTHGCDGGDDRYAMQWASENQGVLKESVYPYDAQSGPCEAPEGKKYTIAKPLALAQSEDALVQAIATYGPISAGIQVPPELQHYTSGIIDVSAEDCAPISLGGHAITIVGYTPDYWIIKNSWSADWGEDGYFRAKRGNNFCDITSHASAAVFA